ncbi:hypothetical protein [Campylobacter coli]|uniref:hypothetical protein n=1 Tax=Campylobacter coli TaxID=195 RepID=UPI002FF1325D
MRCKRLWQNTPKGEIKEGYEDDEKMSVDEWVTDQVSDIRDFLYALKNFKSKYR